MTRKEIIHEFGKIFYESWQKNDRRWLGVHIVKYPTDLFIYQMLIYKNKPDFLIETGTCRGGGALFFASMFDLVGHGHVISIDYRDLKPPSHPRISYIIGKSTADETLKKIRDIVGSGTCMVVLDSDHKSNMVKRELLSYRQFVTPGFHIVAEDTYLNGNPVKPDWGPGPMEAVKWFLTKDRHFVVDPLHEIYMIGMNPGGWLRRI